jgi:HlyD family secretion protein
LSKRILVAASVAIVAAIALWAYFRSSAPPEIPFAKVVRERLESTVSSNGKAEPLAWSAVYSDEPGTLSQVPVARGDTVRRGDVIAVVEAAAAKADLEAATARIAEANQELAVLKQGGSAQERADIDAGTEKARVARDRAREDVESLKKLLARQAATRDELQDAQDRLASADAELKAWEQKRAALSSAEARIGWQARLREAEAQAGRARAAIERATLRAPLSGEVYNLPVRAGDYVTAGTLIAEVGDMARLRVTVYVDEPELGRIRRAAPVTITWDAQPGMQWKGIVDKVPTQVVALGNRQVGNVITIVDNPNHDLLPGTNVNATILCEVADSALTIPKEALRQEDGRPGVFLLDGKVVRWRAVKTGIASVTRIQVVDGLKDGDAIALPGESVLTDGMEVKAIFP